jgi:hypothetical protein
MEGNAGWFYQNSTLDPIGSLVIKGIRGEAKLKKRSLHQIVDHSNLFVWMALIALFILFICSAFSFPFFVIDSQDVSWEVSFDAIDKCNEGRLNNLQLYEIKKELGDHFSEIDYDSKGFVTKNNIRAWMAEKDHDQHEGPQLQSLSPRSAFYGPHATETRL